MQEFVDALQTRQWQQAASHFCGAGLEGGADNRSLRFLLRQLQDAPRGRQLAELLLSISVGGSWLQARKKGE
eukprot:7689936-Pyramimonas_sp.AAC.1